MSTGRSHVMRFLFVHFTLTRLENLYDFFNLCDDFWFNMMLHNSLWLHFSYFGG